uniref:AlNc14C3433G13336 protein n=1 Tax=Albugo laibachii Nc14 TaxID=890382 RepID=F0X2Z4_9STRA|nr:AlNc14C3433G13336 [Albugo laibachii Nc14]|eukprot:CCA28415.1 AlNc14C3433G13336 [Albugo laibachii Nc14]
MRFFIHSDI